MAKMEVVLMFIVMFCGFQNTITIPLNNGTAALTFETAGKTTAEEELSHVSEGDIIIHPDHPYDDDGDDTLGLERRNAVRPREKLWQTRIVPYEIDTSLMHANISILKAIKEFEDKTCLKFYPRTNEDHWMRFVLSNRCASTVGKLYWKKGAQNIYLSKKCLQHNSLVHEIMHTLGFWHEQSRADRDDYVSIYWENIKKGAELNFKKQPPWKMDNLGIEYDYDSIMHYGNHYFLEMGKPVGTSTIEAVGNPTRQLGNKKGLSPKDTIAINALYECSNEDNPSRLWSTWSTYSLCDVNCFKRRQRYCFSKDLKKCPGANHYRVQDNWLQCTKSECNEPIAGHWGKWGEWSKCTEPCGWGRQTRHRMCNDPAPKHSGKTCGGDAAQTAECLIELCKLGINDCDFESDIHCQWKIIPSTLSNEYLWQESASGDINSTSGTIKDHTTGLGYFLVANSSASSTVGVKTSLSSRLLNTSIPDRCLQFSQLLYGTDVGNLHVSIANEKSGNVMTVWKENERSDKSWVTTNITISSEDPYKILITATRGTGKDGDIAIDDIQLIDGKCENDRKDALQQDPSDYITVGNHTLSVEGCYAEKPMSRALTELILTHRSPESSHGDGHDVDWKHFTSSLAQLIEECVTLANAKSKKYIAIHYYGECWTADASNQFKLLGPSTDCINSDYKPCTGNKEICSGIATSNYVYTIINNR